MMEFVSCKDAVYSYLCPFPDLADRNQVDTSSYGSASPTHHPSSPLTTSLHDMNDRTTYAEVTWDNIGGASVYEHQNGFLDSHSSEEELDVINQDEKVEKRNWSQVSQSNGVHPESAGSSDEEIRDLLQPQPIRFSSSPPTGVPKLQYAATPPKLFLANVATTFTVSPRKRHRQTSVSDGTESETEAVIQRPCLDFEKMQVSCLRGYINRNIGGVC